ncbi:MAG: GTP cyclohydrolase I FolE [candidate division WOR-3 bacterium]
MQKLKGTKTEQNLLTAFGEDPTREGLLETPARVAKAWAHWTSGYRKNPKDVLKVFEDGAEGCGDEIVLVANIPVYSTCEHHLAMIWGLAHIGYLPNKKIVGLSKFSRIVEVFARRLQVQERLTNQIADALDTILAPRGVGVVLECRHACMESRGVQARGTITTTSAMRGLMRQDSDLRSEFLQLVRNSSTTKNGI